MPNESDFSSRLSQFTLKPHAEQEMDHPSPAMQCPTDLVEITPGWKSARLESTESAGHRIGTGSAKPRICLIPARVGSKHRAGKSPPLGNHRSSRTTIIAAGKRRIGHPHLAGSDVSVFRFRVYRFGLGFRVCEIEFGLRVYKLKFGFRVRKRLRGFRHRADCSGRALHDRGGPHAGDAGRCWVDHGATLGAKYGGHQIADADRKPAPLPNTHL